LQEPIGGCHVALVDTRESRCGCSYGELDMNT